jgi:hypothetical protein
MDSGREHCSIVLVLTTRSWGGKILLNFVVIQSQITLQQLKKKKKKKKKKKPKKKQIVFITPNFFYFFIYL